MRAFASSKKRNYLLARYARKAVEEISNRITVLKVIDQILDRHACARETRGATHNLRIDFDD